MLISSNAKLLASAFLVAGLAACTTTKTAPPQESTATPQEQAAPATTPGAETTAAPSAGTLSSQTMANQAQAEAARKANQLSSQLGVKVFHFDFDSSAVHSDDYNALKAHALYLSKNPGAHVQVSGHTDERGTREYNMALGERRAKAVSAFLVSNGAKSGQLEVVSYGQEKPVASGETEEAWAQNRRVELEYASGNP